MDNPAAPPIETVEIDRLYCSPTNPRHNDDAVPKVAASIRRFGWQQPIVAKRDGEVIAGNTRLKAAQSLGMTEVPVWWFDGTDLDATAFAIADNRTGEFAEWATKHRFRSRLTSFRDLIHNFGSRIQLVSAILPCLGCVPVSLHKISCGV